MKKLCFIVALFLTGAATQTKANPLNTFKGHSTFGCNHADEIQFVEKGILYTITTDGAFTFDVLDYPTHYKGKKNGKGTKNKPWKYSGKKRKDNRYRVHIIEDRFGRIRTINNTYMSYNRHGQVESIGDIPIYYHRGSLVQIGAMKLVYNRFGEIRNTIGHVNKQNKKFWHDDWNVNNERYRKDVFEGDMGRRIRTK